MAADEAVAADDVVQGQRRWNAGSEDWQLKGANASPSLSPMAEPSA